ncbi:MAG TPA: alpha-glucosidase, partial [Firmicutes bacterium]|nr:alpha-glucosidase [Bacillota bacterium]
FMVGEHMMVAPVVHQGARFRAVYLPEGDWYDYETLEKHRGSNIIIKDAPLDTCPMYIKAGSIIPNYPRLRFVGEMDIKSLILDVYPGSGTFEHIQDDGESFNYQAGEYNHYIFNQGETTLKIETKHVGYNKSYETFTVLYHDMNVESVTADNTPIAFEVRDTGIQFEVNANVS